MVAPNPLTNLRLIYSSVMVYSICAAGLSLDPTGPSPVSALSDSRAGAKPDEQAVWRSEAFGFAPTIAPAKQDEVEARRWCEPSSEVRA